MGVSGCYKEAVDFHWSNLLIHDFDEGTITSAKYEVHNPPCHDGNRRQGKRSEAGAPDEDGTSCTEPANVNGGEFVPSDAGDKC